MRLKCISPYDPHYGFKIIKIGDIVQGIVFEFSGLIQLRDGHGTFIGSIYNFQLSEYFEVI